MQYAYYANIPCYNPIYLMMMSIGIRPCKQDVHGKVGRTIPFRDKKS